VARPEAGTGSQGAGPRAGRPSRLPIMGDFVERSADAAEQDIPPVVYVPCAPSAPDDDDLSVDLRETQDGRLALMVYSGPERLTACCGPHQPWVALRAAELEQVRVDTGFALVLLDVEIPKELWRTA
jgi:hypothetical protein